MRVVSSPRGVVVFLEGSDISRFYEDEGAVFDKATERLSFAPAYVTVRNEDGDLLREIHVDSMPRPRMPSRTPDRPEWLKKVRSVFGYTDNPLNERGASMHHPTRRPPYDENPKGRYVGVHGRHAFHATRGNHPSYAHPVHGPYASPARAGAIARRAHKKMEAYRDNPVGRTVEEAEEKVLADYEAVKGRIVPTTIVTGFFGDSDYTEDRHFDPPIEVRISDRVETRDLLRDMDGWIDPMYDVEPVHPSDLPGVRSAWVYGRSWSYDEEGRSTSGEPGSFAPSDFSYEPNPRVRSRRSDNPGRYEENCGAGRGGRYDENPLFRQGHEPFDFEAALLRGPYAWPGGYPIYFVTGDGGALSFTTAFEERDLIFSALRDRDLNSGWYVVGEDVNWEDPELFDDHTGKRIESAYAEDDAATEYDRGPTRARPDYSRWAKKMAGRRESR